MTRRPHPGVCVYCGGGFTELTWDHVVPRAWYPDSVAVAEEKWKVPACSTCNAEHGKNERELLVRLGLSFGYSDPIAVGIGARAFRSVDPRQAKSPSDYRARLALFRQLDSEIERLSPPPQGGILPNFGPTAESMGKVLAIPVPEEGLIRFGTKVIRGMTYLRTGNVLDASREVEVFVIDNNDSEPVREILERFGKAEERGAAVVFESAWAEDDPVCGVFVITIWQRLKLYGATNPRQSAEVNGT